MWKIIARIRLIVFAIFTIAFWLAYTSPNPFLTTFEKVDPLLSIIVLLALSSLWKLKNEGDMVERSRTDRFALAACVGSMNVYLVVGESNIVVALAGAAFLCLTVALVLEIQNIMLHGWKEDVRCRQSASEKMV